MERTLVVSDNRGTISRFCRVSQGKVATASATVELLTCWILHILHLRALYDPPFQALQAPEKYKGILPVVTRDLFVMLTIVVFGSMSGRSTTNQLYGGC